MEINGTENGPAPHTSGTENSPVSYDIIARLIDDKLALQQERDEFRSRANECTRLIRALDKQIKRAIAKGEG